MIRTSFFLVKIKNPRRNIVLRLVVVLKLTLRVFPFLLVRMKK